MQTDRLSPSLPQSLAARFFRPKEEGAFPGVGNGLGKKGPETEAMGDLLSLSPKAGETFQYARMMFEVNAQVVRQINGEDGSETRAFSFSLKASFEFLEISGAGEAGESDEAAPTDPLEKLRAYFSPEKTAQRILDFALSFFPGSKQHQAQGDTEAGRKDFADYVGGFIQKGFDEAQRILGKLPDPVQADVDETHDRVFQGLDAFVLKGLDPEKAGADGMYSRIQSMRGQLLAEIREAAESVWGQYDREGRVATASSTPGIDRTA